MRGLPSLTAALLASACTHPVSETPVFRLYFIATAPQLGPVSFRDPLGALSPDGRWLAYSVQQHLYLQPVPLGPVVSAGSGPGTIVRLAWSPDSRRVMLDRRGVSPRWRAYELASHNEVPLWPAGFELRSAQDTASRTVPMDSLRQLTWSPVGGRIAGIRVRDRGSELWSFTAGGAGAGVGEELRTCEKTVIFLHQEEAFSVCS